MTTTSPQFIRLTPIMEVRLFQPFHTYPRPRSQARTIPICYNTILSRFSSSIPSYGLFPRQLEVEINRISIPAAAYSWGWQTAACAVAAAAWGAWSATAAACSRACCGRRREARCREWTAYRRPRPNCNIMFTLKTTKLWYTENDIFSTKSLNPTVLALLLENSFTTET